MLEDGTVALNATYPKRGDGWGQPAMCPGAISAAASAGLGVQVILEGRGDANGGGVAAALTLGGAAIGAEAMKLLRPMDPDNKIKGINIDFEVGGSSWKPATGAVDGFTAAFAKVVRGGKLELTMDVPGPQAQHPLTAGSLSAVFEMATYHGNNVTNSTHNWDFKLDFDMREYKNAEGFVVGLMSTTADEQKNPGAGGAIAWQNTTASVVSRFQMLKQRGLRRVALFCWPGFDDVWAGLATEWETQLREFVAQPVGPTDSTAALVTAVLPSDPNASAATRSVLARLAQISAVPQLQMAFGQQRANQQGRGWQSMSGAANRSDILTDTGDWPAVFGFNFASILRDPQKNIDVYIMAVKRVGAIGGLVAAHFPTNNPVGCTHTTKYKNCQKDPTGQPMKNLLPGGTGNKQWTEWLDVVADVCLGVAPTTVLFRPFHENYLKNWWGSSNCSPSEFKAGWQYTVEYLRNTRNVHNMLLVYAPDQPTSSIASPLGYDERWPGDDYADIAAFDHYDHPPTPHHCKDSNFSAQFLQDIHMVVNFALEHGKVPAIAEFGAKTGLHSTLDADWWTKCFLDPIAADPVASKIAYTMTWTNGGGAPPAATNGSHGGFVPMRGDFTFGSFEALYKSNHTLFRREWNHVKTDDETPQSCRIELEAACTTDPQKARSPFASKQTCGVCAGQQGQQLQHRLRDASGDDAEPAGSGADRRRAAARGCQPHLDQEC